MIHKFIYNAFVRTRTANVPLRTVMTESYFTSSGRELDKNNFLDHLTKFQGDVILLGENHCDKMAHKLELDILQHLHSNQKTELALALEFYDRESQNILDEYINGLCNDKEFFENSNPPGNWKDYQPLLEYCRSHKIPAIASNCPSRFTQMVRKEGRDSLEKYVNSHSDSQRLLPPLPYALASHDYKDSFLEIMASLGNTNLESVNAMLNAQSLWDATMADSISKNLEHRKLIFHVSGYFHVKRNLGILEHLENYRPGIQAMTVIILPVENPSRFIDEEYKNLADFLILTDLSSCD